MHLGGVNGGDGGVGVRVGGEQGALGLREQLHRLSQHLQARHLRHALVGEHEGDAVAARLQLLQQIHRAGAGVGTQDAIVFAILAAEIALYRPQDFGFIVHRDNRRRCHLE